MKRSMFVVAVAAAALLTSCAGVGSKSGDSSGGSAPGATPTGALKIMGFGGEDEVAQARVAAFKAAYPSVAVTNNKGEFDPQQFLTALASANPPDLVYMDRNLVGTYAKKGAIVPLGDCMSSQTIDTSQYREAAMRSVTLTGKVYGIPEFYVVSTRPPRHEVPAGRRRQAQRHPDQGLAGAQGDLSEAVQAER